MENGNLNGSTMQNGSSTQVEIICGPLLNYKGMSDSTSGTSRWRGSVLIVTKSSRYRPQLKLQYSRAWDRAASSTLNSSSPLTEQPNDGLELTYEHDIVGVKLFEDTSKTFWRFAIDVPIQSHEACWTYTVMDATPLSNAKPQSPCSHSFVVPSDAQSMRMMFHSCNGFSVGTDEEAWSGSALWNDVLRLHEHTPFHVMIGGGDQIYNDAIRVKGPLKAWTAIGNPKRRRDYPFDEVLRERCDSFYCDNYINWYSSEPFSSANCQIPQINIWDDHDIIDGFGSYTDHFMKCAVFRGIGSISFKYYCLFQHHVPPPKSTFTTSSPQTTTASGANDGAVDPIQLKNTYVQEESPEDPSFILGARPGPYIMERSRSIFVRLGASVAFLGIDARTERTRHEINYPETYDLIFERARSELSASTKNNITHLIVLLGVPIAYPRLIWLENIFTSPIIGPIRFLSKRFGIAGGLFNHFDGQVDLLDDLDDHYTARQHKYERKNLMLRLQALASEYNVRITILGGDVHLAAVGRFYANPKLNVATEHDHRYMVNVISSAIVNKPPPKAVADFLARRNKIHHLDHDTDETLMKVFNKDPGGNTKTANFNKVTMPSRNYAIISESRSHRGSSQVTDVGQHNGNISNGDSSILATRHSVNRGYNNGHSPLHSGEEEAGTQNPAVTGSETRTRSGGLDVCLRVEIDQHDREGKTEAYGFYIPPLQTQGKL